MAHTTNANGSQESIEEGLALVEHLVHFAGARTNPYVIRISRQICQDLTLSISGQRHLNKALNDLPCLTALDDRLTFGWSYEHAIRSSRVHQTGYEHLTLLITFAECFHEEYGAEVLHHFAKLKLPEDKIGPHIYQWRDLLHFCNGILAGDEFSLLLEFFLNLDPHTIAPGALSSPERCMVPPDAFAGVLVALAELVSGKRRQLSIRGGGAVAYIAALAQYFYDLKIVIENEKSESLHGVVEGAQLKCCFIDKPELYVDDNSEMGRVTRQMSAINIDEQAYPTRVHFFPYGGRTTWQTALPQIYGHKFYKLETEHTKLLFTAIGCAYRAIEHSERGASTYCEEESANDLGHSPPKPVAIELQRELLAYLPTLQRGAGRIERQYKLNPRAASKAYLAAIRQLCEHCRCHVCRTAMDKIEPSESPSPEITGHCLPNIVETIIAMSLVLSRLILVQGLNPSREGLQLFYAARAAKFGGRDRNQLDPGPDDIAALYDDIPWEPTPRILRHAAKMFAGGHLPLISLPKNLVGVAHEGICVFVSELAGGINVRRDLRGMIRVVNGGFALKQKAFTMAAYGAKPTGRDSWKWEKVRVNHIEGQLWMR